jgi:hypothetical protein
MITATQIAPYRRTGADYRPTKGWGTRRVSTSIVSSRDAIGISLSHRSREELCQFVFV